MADQMKAVFEFFKRQVPVLVSVHHVEYLFDAIHLLFRQVVCNYLKTTKWTSDALEKWKPSTTQRN